MQFHIQIKVLSGPEGDTGEGGRDSVENWQTEEEHLRPIPIAIGSLLLLWLLLLPLRHLPRHDSPFYRLSFPI